MVKDTLINTREAPGPSSMDADGWRRILISGNFGNAGEDLRKSMAETAKILYQERSANYLATFVACRL